MFLTSSRIWLINILLAALVVFFGIMSFNVWSKGDEAVPEILTDKVAGTPPLGKRIMERAMPPESTYETVAAKNLFFSNRKESLPADLKSGSLKISEKMIFLYGVVLMGDRKQALISNPESGPEAGKSRVKEKWVKVGDTMGNLSVAEIRKDRIILAEGASRHEILLYDKNKPTRQVIVAEKPTAPAVVSSGPSAATAPAVAAKPGTELPKPGIAEGKSAPAGEYKIVNTPFGPIKRKVE